MNSLLTETKNLGNIPAVLFINGMKRIQKQEYAHLCPVISVYERGKEELTFFVGNRLKPPCPKASFGNLAFSNCLQNYNT